MGNLRSRLTYANVISTLCLFMLLGGGAYAAAKLPKNSVGTKQLKNGAVTGKKIKKGTIDASKLTPAAVAGFAGTQGASGATGPQGAQGTPGDPGVYATVLVGEKLGFAGPHPGFTAVELIPPTGETEEEIKNEAGVYCLTLAPGVQIGHPIASVNWADSSGNGLVEPLAREANFSKCAEGQLAVRTYGFPGPPIEPELRPSNDISFSVFMPGA